MLTTPLFSSGTKKHPERDVFLNGAKSLECKLLRQFIPHGVRDRLKASATLTLREQTGTSPCRPRFRSFLSTKKHPERDVFLNGAKSRNRTGTGKIPDRF